MAYTVNDVKELREKTGIGMMDCKKALEESDGDMDKAIQILREKGLAASIKKGDRVAAEGLVEALVEGNIGAVVEINSETDFVAKNEEFQAFVKGVADVIIKQNPSDVEALLATPYSDGNTVDDELKAKILKIGENIKIRRFHRAEGALASYVHAGGSIGVLVEFDTDLADKPEFAAIGNDIALQIAAMSPKYLTESEIPAEDIAKEKEILMNQAINEGKPENIAEKMVEGRIKKMFKELCLLDQEFVKDDSMSISAYLEAKGKELGGKIAVKHFTRFEKGEGIEKEEGDFAGEIASMVKPS